MDQIKLKQNIKKNYLYIFIKNIDLTRGIWMIYLASKGMSLTQLGLLETVYHLTSFTMEVPTGAVADIFGRKISRVMGRMLSLVSVVVLLLSDSFLLFAVSFIFTALSNNLESGAGDALIYDSLKEINEENRFMKVAGYNEIFYQTASTLSFLFGGYLASKSYDMAFLLTIVIAVLAIIHSFSFKEPSIGRIHKEAIEGNIFFRQLRESMAVVKNSPRIMFLIIFAESIGAFSTCIFFYLQNFLKLSGYNEAVIGVIYAVSSLGAALIATQTHKIERKIKERGILLVIPFITAACMWGIALSRFHYIFFVILMLTEGIIFVAVSDYINKMIPSENRATILSFASMVFSFFMITMFPLIGIIGDRYSLSVAFVCLGIVSSLFVIGNSFLMVAKAKKI